MRLFLAVLLIIEFNDYTIPRINFLLPILPLHWFRRVSNEISLEAKQMSYFAASSIESFLAMSCLLDFIETSQHTNPHMVLESQTSLNKYVSFTRIILESLLATLKLACRANT